jgi:predicted DNA-binding transcriptional regulator AlpA|tara:strand:- start:223 stop:441 length:219 start_codon:yes stop_codon:yes gene_type:complete
MNTQIINLLQEIKMELKNKKNNTWMDIKKVCEITTLSASTVRRAVNRGKLKCSKKLGKLLFMESDVRQWING